MEKAKQKEKTDEYKSEMQRKTRIQAPQYTNEIVMMTTDDTESWMEKNCIYLMDFILKCYESSELCSMNENIIKRIIGFLLISFISSTQIRDACCIMLFLSMGRRATKIQVEN